jgi:hypothetical protein
MSIGSIPIISPFNPDWNRQHSHNSCIPALPIPGLPRDEDICLLWFGYSQYSFLRTPTSNCSWPPNVCASASSSPQSLSKKNLGSSALCSTKLNVQNSRHKRNSERNIWPSFQLASCVIFLNRCTIIQGVNLQKRSQGSQSAQRNHWDWVSILAMCHASLRKKCRLYHPKWYLWLHIYDYHKISCLTFITCSYV